MVVILVVLMFGTLALIGLARRRRAEQLQVATAARTAPGEVWYHPGHTWAAPAHAGYFKVGLDELAASLTGLIERVNLPREGAQVFQGVPSVEVRRGRRTLELASPLTGKVVAVNPKLKDDAATASREPYGNGWLYLVRPGRRYERGNLIGGLPARRWLDQIRTTLGNALRPGVPATAYDAGPLTPGFGEHLTDEQFWQLKQELFPNSR